MIGSNEEVRPKCQIVTKAEGVCGIVYIGPHGIVYCEKTSCSASDKAARTVRPKGEDAEITVYTCNRYS